MTDVMVACLPERTLLVLVEGGGNREERTHLRGCVLCAGRYQRLVDDVARIARVLHDPPPPPTLRLVPRWLPAAAAAVATAAVLLAVLALPRRGGPAAAGADGLHAFNALSATVFATGTAEPAAIRTTDGDILAAALEEPWPCEWSTGGCDDDTDPLFGGE